MSQTNSLDQLKQFTTVVADTGDFESIRAYAPQDATTNPTLIFKAVQQAEYKPLLAKAVADNRSSSLTGAALHRKVIDDLLVAFGNAAGEVLAEIRGDSDPLVKRIAESYVAFRNIQAEYTTQAYNGVMNARRLPIKWG